MSSAIISNNSFLKNTIETAVSAAVFSKNLKVYSSYDVGVFTEEVLTDIGFEGASLSVWNESLYYTFTLAVESLFIEGLVGGGAESSERFIVGAILANPAFRRWVFQQPFYQKFKSEILSKVQGGTKLFGKAYLREYVRDRIVEPGLRMIDCDKRLWLHQLKRSALSSYQNMQVTFQERGFVDGALQTSADLAEQVRGLSFKGYSYFFSMLDGAHLTNAVQIAGLTGFSATPLLYTTANYSDLALRTGLTVAARYSGYVTTATVAANLLAPVVRMKVFPHSSERAIQAFVLNKGLQIQREIADLDKELQTAPIFIQESVRRAPDLMFALILATGCFSNHIEAAFATPYVFEAVGTALRSFGFSSSGFSLKNKLKKAPIQLLVGSCAQLALGNGSYVELTSIITAPFVLEKIEKTALYEQFYASMEKRVFPEKMVALTQASWRMNQIGRIFGARQLTWAKKIPQVVVAGQIALQIYKKKSTVQKVQRIAKETVQAGYATYMGYVRLSLMEGWVGNFASLIELMKNPLSPTKITAVAAGVLIHTYSEDPMAAAFTIPVVEQVIENSGVYRKLQSKVYEWGNYLKNWVSSSKAVVAE